MGNKKELLIELMKWTVDVKPISSNTLSYIWFVIYICLISATLRVILITTTEFNFLILLVILTHLIQNLLHYMFRLEGFFVIGGLIAFWGILPTVATELISISISFIIGCMIAYLIGSINQFTKKEID